MEPKVNIISDWSKVPGSNTYFTNTDVMPFVDGDGVINIYNSRGQSRSWGTPRVTSTVSKLSEDVVKVTVVGWHKHTISPVGGDYYFVCEAGKWMRRRANANAVKAVLGG